MMDHGQFHAVHMPELALSPPGTPKAGAGAGVPAGFGQASPSPYALPKELESPRVVHVTNPMRTGNP